MKSIIFPRHVEVRFFFRQDPMAEICSKVRKIPEEHPIQMMEASIEMDDLPSGKLT